VMSPLESPRGRPYERARRIEQRFEQAIRLMRDSRSNAAVLAAALEVSVPTVQRMVAELRRRGIPVRSVRDEQGWGYEVVAPPRSTGDAA
jgi:predicted DNA-binding transcriptional regulator YafY